MPIDRSDIAHCELERAEKLGPGPKLSVLFQGYAWGVCLQSWSDSRRLDRVSATIRWARDPEVIASAGIPRSWFMRARISREMQDVFGGFLRAVRTQFAFLYPGDLELSEMLTREVWKILMSVSAFAVKRCDQNLRKVVDHYPPDIRFEVYKLLASDDTDHRLTQLVGVCPGAVTFGLGAEARLGKAGSEILHGMGKAAKSGRSLNRTLDEAVENWISACRADRAFENSRLSRLGLTSYEQSTKVRPNPTMTTALGSRYSHYAWQRLFDLRGESLRRAQLTQRLLIRRAGPSVRADHLVFPGPTQFAPENIPSDRCENAIWYQLVTLAQTVIRPDLGEEDRIHTWEQWVRYASRYALTLYRQAGGLRLATRVIEEVRDYINCLGRSPPA